MDQQASKIIHKLHRLQIALVPTLRKSIKAGLKVMAKAVSLAAPKAKEERRVHGVHIQPGLTAGAIGTSVKYETEEGIVRGKMGLNVARTRAATATSGIPGKNKSYYGPWGVTGTNERFRGLKTRRKTIAGVTTVRFVKTGNPIKSTGRLIANNFVRTAAAASFAAAKQASLEVMTAAVSELID